jgi:hypothetical protein
MLTHFTTLSQEMHDSAQTAILEWLSNQMRVRIGNHSPTQQRLTLAMVQAGLDETLRQYEAHALAAPALDEAVLRASLFRSAYTEISIKMMVTMGSGVGGEEQRLLSSSGGDR